MRGTWGPAWQAILELDASFLAAYLELMEVLEIASVIGIHAATTAGPILVEELTAAGLLPAG
ncbi:MAG TPA: hypothetical protein VGP36_10525 [Mycobacteriales bacterium]|nr:hypothetical protein [Mycobacteriales bacterium]